LLQDEIKKIRMKVVGKPDMSAVIVDLKKELKDVKSQNFSLDLDKKVLRVALNKSDDSARIAETELERIKHRVETQQKAENELSDIVSLQEKTISRLEGEVKQLKWERAETMRVARSEKTYREIMDKRKAEKKSERRLKRKNTAK
jgi:hypothetical protein